MNIDICGKCPLFNDHLLELGIRKTHKINSRYYNNPDKKKVLILGECGGLEEDEQNLPFVGRAGKILTSIIEESNLNSFNVCISNVVKCRAIDNNNGKYKNRNPTPEEVNACSPYLVEDFAFNPELTIALGKTASSSLFPDKDYSLIRGKLQIFNYQGKEYKTLVSYHPAACLYNPSVKPLLTKHLINAVKFLSQ